MSENDFNAAYRGEENLAGEGHVPPPKHTPDVRSTAGTPASSDPLDPLEPIIPPVLDEPGVVGGDASLSGAGTLAADTGSGRGREATDEAGGLARDGKESARQVGDTAKREAESVVEDIKEQTSNLLDELGSDIRAQAATQQEKLSTNLRQISEELRGMLANSDASGTTFSLVDQAARHSGNAADWLGNREPGALMGEVKDFARRRPGAFLGIALGAGLLAGRITRNAGNEPEHAGKNAAANPRRPEADVPRTVSQLPPTGNPTIGSGAVGGTGSYPVADPYPAAVRDSEQGYTGP